MTTNQENGPAPYLNDPLELDLSSSVQQKITEGFGLAGKDMGIDVETEIRIVILSALKTGAESDAVLIKSMPFSLWQRIAYESASRARDSGDPVDKESAGWVWHYMQHIQRSCQRSNDSSSNPGFREVVRKRKEERALDELRNIKPE